MGNVDGWANKPNEQFYANQNLETYRRIREAGTVSITQGLNAYGHSVYKGIALPSVSDQEILAYCDKGNACFGGYVLRSGSRFTAKVVTE